MSILSAMERIKLAASAVSTGPDATELVVAFKLADRMSDVAVAVDESATEVVLTVEATWSPILEASGGWLPHLSYSSLIAPLTAPLGERRVRTATPGVC